MFLMWFLTISRFLLVSTTEKFDCESKIQMKYRANLLEK